MTDDSGASIPDVVVKKARGPSIVWLVPIVAAVVAGWIWWQAVQERGPVITIVFETAEGLEAGKTAVKHREVQVGQVETIELLADLTGVRVTVQLVPDTEEFLTDRTRFWVVRPRVGTGGVTGLGTLLSGAYIEASPSRDGARTTAFTGLELPPLRPADAPGLRITLESPRLGSLSVGSPVMFRDLAIGQVERLRLTDDAQGAEIDLYIEEEHAELVRSGTRFWNASGIRASLGAEGISFAASSLDAMLRGGIDCDTPPGADAGHEVFDGHRFPLFEDYEASREIFTISEEVVMHFDGTVRGLLPGAPVEFRGIKLGEVTDVSLVFDQETKEVRMPVRAVLQPERITRVGSAGRDPRENLRALVDQGLRAQLATGSLLTGALYVDLEFRPEAPMELRGDGSLPEFPTVPSTAAQIQATLGELPGMVEDLRAVIEDVRGLVESPEIASTLASLDRTMAGGPALVASVEETLAGIDAAVAALQSTVAEESDMRYRAVEALTELRDTLRSTRALVEYLERHPESLLTGKENP